MNCYIHPDRPAVGTCVSCGRPICNECAVEMNGKLVCRECLASGKVSASSSKDVNTAFIIELIAGFFGFLGVGYLYVGKTNDGIIRLICWIIYGVIAYITIVALSTIFIGLLCVPFQLIIQVGIPLWSATNLKNSLSSSG